jgi:hypothetical protein
VTKEAKQTISDLIKNLPEELRTVADEAYLRDLSELGTDDSVRREYELTFVELSTLALKEMMKALTPQIAKAEELGDKEKLEELQARFVGLSKRLNSAIIPD